MKTIEQTSDGKYLVSDERISNSLLKIIVKDGSVEQLIKIIKERQTV